MSILVDSSVWIDFFNGHPSAEAAALRSFIEQGHAIATCGVVLAEVLQGFRDGQTAKKLEPYFRDMVYYAPIEPQTYLTAANVYRSLRRTGITVRSTIDCLIACLAAENQAFLLAKDRDMDQIIGSGLLAVRRAVPLPC